MIDPSSAGEPRWLGTADGLSRQLITQAAPIRFTVADGARELQAVFALRHQTVVEEGWATDEEMTDGLERDEYDDHASQVAAWDGDVLAGTLRVVFPRPDLPLPVEKSHGLVVEPRGEVVGAGRVIVAQPYRHQGHTVLGGLSATAWLLMRQRGFRWAAGTATNEILDLFRRLGFEVTILGDAQTHWGEKRYPIRMGAPDPSRWV